MTKKDSSSLTARQKARQAIAQESEQLKRRQSALEAGFSALDGLDDMNTTAGDALGLTAREVGAYIKAAKTADDDSASGDSEPQEPATPAGSGGEQSVSAVG